MVVTPVLHLMGVATMHDGILTHRLSVEISQEGNTEGTTDATEVMTIDINALWIGGSDPGFAVIHTEGWSVNDGAEMAQIIDAVQDAAQGLTEKLRSFSVTGQDV